MRVVYMQYQSYCVQQVALQSEPAWSWLSVPDNGHHHSYVLECRNGMAGPFSTTMCWQEGIRLQELDGITSIIISIMRVPIVDLSLEVGHVLWTGEGILH